MTLEKNMWRLPQVLAANSLSSDPRNPISSGVLWRMTEKTTRPGRDDGVLLQEWRPRPGGWRSSQPRRVVPDARVSTGEGGTGKLAPGPRSGVWLRSRKNLAQVSVSLLFVVGSVNTQ